jgi:putative endonuclease
MTCDARTTLGRLGERLAAEHFGRLGWEILARNYRTRFGELDLVAVEGETLVFAEVKTCRAAGRARPWDSLHGLKRAQVRRMSTIWLAEFRPRPYFHSIRFDAVGVLVDDRDRLVRLDHLRKAF